MREILFRGFHPCDCPETIVVDGEKVKGRWVEGYIVRHPSAIQIGNDDSPWYIHVPPADPDDNGGVFNVLPSTVGEWTGFCDKNGRRIYEGDRVRLSGGNWTDAPETAEIELHAGCWCASYPNVPWCFLVAKVKDAEVIGTVFDEVTP